MLYQLFEHPLAQSSWHIKLTITKAKMPLNFIKIDSQIQTKTNGFGFFFFSLRAKYWCFLFVCLFCYCLQHTNASSSSRLFLVLNWRKSSNSSTKSKCLHLCWAQANSPVDRLNIQIFISVSSLPLLHSFEVLTVLWVLCSRTVLYCCCLKDR